MNKKSTTVLIIACIVFCVAAGIFSYTLYDVSNQSIKLAESKQLISEYTAKEAAYNSVQNLLTSTKEDRDKIKKLFIKEKDAITFISEIEQDARTVGVMLTTNELSVVQTSTDANGVVTPGVLIVGFDFSGREAAVAQFMTLLENIPYHKKINDVSVAKADTDVWKANVKMQLTLRYD